MHPAAPFAALAVLLALAPWLGASRCAEGPRAARAPAAPATPLLDARGRLDPRGVEAWIDAIEDRRGLRFLRRPVLVIAPPEGPDAPADAGGPEPAPGACIRAPDGFSVRCRPPLDAGAFAAALAELIDAQHHPRLVALAPELPGDPGRTLRALLAARAQATLAGGLGPPLDPPPPSPLDAETLEIARTPEAGDFLVLAATTFLRVQRDREAPLRHPPLSSRELLRPADHAAGFRPVRLEGPAPRLGGCRPEADESVGPGALLVAATRAGGAVSGTALGAWRGDRLVRLACRDARAPWIYAAAFDDAAAAAGFAAHAETLLPGDLARPFETLVPGARVLAWHDLPRDAALAFAAQLVPAELRSLDALAGDAAGAQPARASSTSSSTQRMRE